MAAFFLLRYLHAEWQLTWALGCGLFAGVFLRRAVAPIYGTFPTFLRRPLDVSVVLLGAIVAVSATLVAPRYGGITYFLAHWREAVALPTIAVVLGLGIASIVYTHSRLEREVEQRERLEEDLRLAHGIQQSLLRSQFPSLPWVEARALNIPSRSVGGDYYEIFDASAEQLGFAIGDVSGKGVPAALLMSTLQSAFLGVSGNEADLSKVCSRVNSFLVDRTSQERYATFFVGRLFPDARLDYVNAGHNPPLLLRGDETTRLMGGGLPLGLFAHADYELQRVDLAPGDALLCYTDGVTESLNPEEEEFGEERLIEAALRSRDNGAEGVVAAVRAAVDEHTRGTPQFDDLTLLVLCLK